MWFNYVGLQNINICRHQVMGTLMLFLIKWVQPGYKVRFTDVTQYIKEHSSIFGAVGWSWCWCWSYLIPTMRMLLQWSLRKGFFPLWFFSFGAGVIVAYWALVVWWGFIVSGMLSHFHLCTGSFSGWVVVFKTSSCRLAATSVWIQRGIDDAFYFLLSSSFNCMNLHL